MRQHHEVRETVAKPNIFRRLSRLSDAADFRRVFERNRRSVDGFFKVLCRPNELGYPRLGLAIAKKGVRYAVARNRLKRIIRESFRGAKQQLNGLDIVIMSRGKAATALNPELFASLDRHWQVLGKLADGRGTDNERTNVPGTKNPGTND